MYGPREDVDEARVVVKSTILRYACRSRIPAAAFTARIPIVDIYLKPHFFEA